MSEPFADRPKPCADEENRQWNHKPRRGSHQSINADALAISLTGTAKNRKGRHVCGKDRQEKNHRPNGPAGEKEILGILFAFSESDAADDGNDRQVNANDNDGDHEKR